MAFTDLIFTGCVIVASIRNQVGGRIIMLDRSSTAAVAVALAAALTTAGALAAD